MAFTLPSFLGNLQFAAFGDKEMTGGTAADYLFGGFGNDTIYGLDGADSLSGGSGNDILVGGPANDKLSGGLGADIYRFGIGDGADTIALDLSNAKDTIELTDRNTANLAKSGNDLLIGFSDNATDSITVKGAFSANAVGMPSIKFANESVMSANDIKAAVGFESVDYAAAFTSNLQQLVTGLSSAIENVVNSLVQALSSFESALSGSSMPIATPANDPSNVIATPSA
jgi:hypothetical protein